MVQMSTQKLSTNIYFSYHLVTYFTIKYLISPVEKSTLDWTWFFFLHQTYKITHSHLSHMWAYLNASWASFVAQMLKNLSVMQETWLLPVGWEQLPTLAFWPGEFRGLYIVHGITNSRPDLVTFSFTNAS